MVWLVDDLRNLSAGFSHSEGWFEMKGGFGVRKGD